MAEKFDFVDTDSAKLYTTIIGKLMEHCGEALFPGDERRIYSEALVAVLVALYSEFNDKMKQRTLQYSRGVVLDAIGERLGVVRIAPACASATFRFTVSAVQTENIIIPEGTRITPDGIVYFETQEAAVLPAGASYVDILGVCTVGGSGYNGYDVGTIATLVDLIPYISTVENITVTDDGDDGEPYTADGDNRLRERIRLAPSALSTAGSESGYRYFALSADPNIADVSIDCPEDEPNTVNIYPLMYGGEAPDADTLAKVEDACSAENVRPMTDLVTAIAPTAVEFAVKIKYHCTKNDETAIIQAIEGEGGAIDQYVEWQTAALARHIDPDQLRSFIFAAKSATSATGTVRIEITSPSYTELTKMQYAKLSGTPVVSHEVVIA